MGFFLMSASVIRCTHKETLQVCPGRDQGKGLWAEAAMVQVSAGPRETEGRLCGHRRPVSSSPQGDARRPCVREHSEFSGNWDNYICIKIKNIFVKTLAFHVTFQFILSVVFNVLRHPTLVTQETLRSGNRPWIPGPSAPARRPQGNAFTSQPHFNHLRSY